MAKELYDHKTNIIFKRGSPNGFYLSEMLYYLNSSTYLNGNFRLLTLPFISYRINLQSSERTKIEVEFNYSLGENIQHPFNEKEIITIGNKYGEFAESVILFLDVSGNVLFLRKHSKTILVDENSKNIEEIPLTRPNLVKILNTPNFERAYFVIVDDHCHYIDEDYFYKALYNDLLQWFDNLFPGVIVADSCENSVKVSSDGIKLLFVLYMNTIGVSDASSHTFDIEYSSRFSLNPDYKTRINKLDDKLFNLFHNAVRDTISTPKKEDDEDLPGGYEDSLLTDLVIDKEIDEFVNCTWSSFVRNIEKFNLECNIKLAEGQVIVDKNNFYVFDAGVVDKLVYYGMNYDDGLKRFLLEMVVKCPVSKFFCIRAKKFFDDEIKVPLLAIRSNKIENPEIYWTNAEQLKAFAQSKQKGS